MTASKNLSFAQNLDSRDARIKQSFSSNKRSFYNWGFENGSLLLNSLTRTLLNNRGYNLPFQPYKEDVHPELPTSKFPKVSIIFPNLNGNKGLLSALFSSIEKSSYPKDKIETIMIDNNSTDDSVKFVEKKFHNFKLIKLKKNQGFAKAVNIGAKRSSGKYLFVTNNDVELEKNCIKNLVQFLVHNPKVGVVGARVNDYKNRSQIACSALAYSFFTGNFVMSAKFDQIQNSDWVIGCSMCTSRSLWKKLSGFDEKFFFSGEELDFCLRAKYLGYKIIYNPKALLWHVGSATSKKRTYTPHSFEIYKSKLRIILKHGSRSEILIAFFIQFLIFLPYRTLLMHDKSIFPLIKASIWNIKHLPKNLFAQRKSILYFKKAKTTASSRG